MNPIAAAVIAFLDLFYQEQEAGQDLGAMIRQLDLLACLAHDVAFECDDRPYSDPPECDRGEAFAQAEQWLQEMRQTDSSQEFATWEAMNDLTEIVSDLTAVRWAFENTSEANALFEYQLGFHTRWGHHLRSLQKVLHEWYW